jgi:nucleoside-diphosphate-sugar epimerase
MTDTIAPTRQRILLCGHRAFAARGLPDLLKACGHEVICFSRGKVDRQEATVTGPIEAMDSNEHLAGDFDTVINYILLKDDDIEKNNRFLESLLRFCASHHVKHLVHLSSVSVYSGDASHIVEDAPVETVPSRKGSYGSLKVGTDLYLAEKTPADLRLSMVRPGFILGMGLMDPMIGMGLRFMHNRVLVLGDAKNQLPVVTRDQVNDSIVRIVNLPETQKREAFLILDPNSPLRDEWLKGCCTQVGAGTGLIKLPRWFWRLAGFGATPLVKLAGMNMKPNQMMRNICRRQRFDSTRTQTRLGMSMKVDWHAALRGSFAGQDQNFQWPYTPAAVRKIDSRSICYLGFGQVVKQKHLPGLKRLGFSGNLSAFDLAAGRDPGSGVEVKPLENAVIPQSDLIVVASPGPVHNLSLPLLRTTSAPIMVEKPLCYTNAEFDEWLDFAKGRTAPVYVCQNFRYKSNVQQMLAHLQKFNPGKLLRADVLFQSPSIAKEWRTWTRDERRARTLLMDYSVHYLDLACMFNRQGWNLGGARYELDGTGFTSLIDGRFESDSYPVNFTLRQGFMPRVAQITYVFQNYFAILSFFPDAFTAHMSDDGDSIHKTHAKAQARATRAKIIDKLTRRDSDVSHATTLGAIANRTPMAGSLEVKELESYYRALFQLAGAVYEK